MTIPREVLNIALIGFMGTGKSSVGQIVAAHLRFDYVDTDQLIEERAGRTIADIFSQDGEPAFRQLERQVAQELTSSKRVVISTGGGLPVDPANMSALKEHSLVVCLWATAETIYERVRRQTHRPLLNQPDPLARIQELLAARTPAYRQADVLVNTEMRSPKEVAQHVIHQFRMATSGR